MSEPLRIDNTWVESFDCPRRGFHRQVECLTKPAISPALSFGASVHAGIAAWLIGKTPEESIDIAVRSFRETNDPEDWRTPQRAREVLTLYFQRERPPVYRLAGTPIVEADFALPLFSPEEKEHPVRLRALKAGHSDVHYTGILDDICVFTNRNYVEDHKTASRAVRSPRGLAPYLDLNFFTHFKPHGATPGYVWAARQLIPDPIAGVMIDAIGCNERHCVFGMSTIEWTAAEIEEWRQDVIAKLDMFLACKERGYFPKSPSQCFTYGSTCQFADLCTVQGDARENAKALYVHSKWDALTARAKEAAEVAA